MTTGNVQVKNPHNLIQPVSRAVNGGGDATDDDVLDTGPAQSAEEPGEIRRAHHALS